MIQSLRLFSSVCPLLQMRLHHLLSPPQFSGVSAHLWNLSCHTRDILLAVYHTSEPQEIEPWLASHSTTNLILKLFTHPPQLTVTWVPPSSIQSSFLSQSRNDLWEEVTPDWHTSRGWPVSCFPSQLLAVNSCTKGGRWPRPGSLTLIWAAQPDN